jgi:hypothetical protein
MSDPLDDIYKEYERTQTIGGFAVGDRVRPKLNDCYGKVTRICQCDYRNDPIWLENCCNIEMECLNPAHTCHSRWTHSGRTIFPANELEHLD